MRLLAIIIASVALFTQPIMAADWPTPDAAYSANRVMDGGGMQMVGKVYHDHGKERWEADMGGMSQVRIMRPDLNKMMMLMPQMNMGMEMPFDGGMFTGPPADYDGPQPEKMGNETVAGEETTKFQVVTTENSGTYTTTAWVTDDGIVMRMEVQSFEGDFAMYLEGLSRGPQDAALFEMPAGVQMMPANPAMLNPLQ